MAVRLPSPRTTVIVTPIPLSWNQAPAWFIANGGVRARNGPGRAPQEPDDDAENGEAQGSECEDCERPRNAEPPLKGGCEKVEAVNEEVCQFSNVVWKMMDRKVSLELDNRFYSLRSSRWTGARNNGGDRTPQWWWCHPCGVAACPVRSGGFGEARIFFASSTAPAFVASPDFAIDKGAGQPCLHHRLRAEGFQGCVRLQLLRRRPAGYAGDLQATGLAPVAGSCGSFTRCSCT